ncbi:MAG: PQQ-binding-like beta-propeller repeat protein [Mariniblastus sp.]
MKMLSILLLAILSCWVTMTNSLANRSTDDTDWPTFRGNGGTGVADGFDLPTEWNADESSGELRGVLWQTPVPGLGHSSPIIVGDRIYLATAISTDGKSPLKVDAGGGPKAADDTGEQSWVVICYDKKSGNEIWRRTAKKGKPRATRHAKATHANTSLTVEGENLVAFFGSEGLYCFDLDGNLKWSQDLGVINISKYGIGWGYASSPAVANNRIVVVCDDPSNPFVAALSLADGKEIWRVARKDICERSWGTPLIHETKDRTQVVVNGWPWITSYDLDSGDELWRLKGGGDNPVPTPFVANDWIYITNAHGGPAPIFVVRPDASGDITPESDDQTTSEKGAPNPAIVWSRPKGGSYLSTPVVYQDHLYLGNTNAAVRCFHAKTGEKVFQERLDAKAGIIASLVAADDKIFCASENGTVYVLAAGAKFKILARNKMGAPCLATPAISNGVIFIRTTESLVAISNDVNRTSEK